ncbi:Sphingomyelin phosphodiesterase [Zootermopsis nevadensis]|uniref:Sphingomyelin phosphodiesterase n=2 Tax=Zootermopsis nevadensis TaxID=136037 RepID=A0A067QNE2_ZOONE|nr:Sphingomyelin phosphodiesterase [Zootermopsis nevadensis]
MSLQRVITVAVLTVTICVAINATSLTERQMRDEVLHGFRQFDITGKFTPQLSAIMKQIPLSSAFGTEPFKPSTETRDSVICMGCTAAVDVMKEYIASHTRDEVFNVVHTMCIEFTQYSTEVCAGSIGLHLDSIIYIVENTEDLPAARVCGIVFQGNGCSRDEPSLEWSIEIGPKPEANKIDNKKADVKDADSLTVIHMTDIHHDPIYLVGGNTACGQPMCCRSVQGSPPNEEAAAGYWGDNRGCDIPLHHFVATLQQVKAAHQNIDFIYITGDFVDHAVWDSSVQTNIGVITNITNQLKNHLPNTIVYPVLGNHEPSPLNVFAPHYITDEKVSTKWLYELIADLWSVWLPPDARETILRGGFYTAVAKPGFRIIGLNNNVCTTENWWMNHNPKDQDGQLQWLADTLLQAEEDGEKVHILGHIPSDRCMRTWSREFHRIIDRFENTVTAIFNGHSHGDHFNIYYSTDEPTHAIGVAFNGGSLVPNSNTNYKTYSVDSTTFNVLNSESWTFDMVEANKYPYVNPNWNQLYSFQDVFGVESQTATEMEKLTHKLAVNRSLLHKYSR